MKGELLSIIEFMEKDRGLDRGTVLEAVEHAIETAARKIEGIPAGVKVQINQESGEITAFSDVLIVPDGEEGPEPENEEDPPIPWMHLEEAKQHNPEAAAGGTVRVHLDMDDFGRIAAQTAKQVIIQRIREAEREKILTEYTQKIGDLVYGTVSRYERGNLIIDIGRTEAIMPRREQSPIERYRQGDRIRALVLDVRDTEEGHVPRVVLSRANPGLIRRLFEIEVPEIYDGIVEIKALAREAGFRTKIAVVSHDVKIDSVGACVGVRGSRVKNIVQEIGGEKIDIVRWSENIEEFVGNALHPVEIVRTFADPDTERILVVVPDDQLSLAIGKSGQNIRLTSKVTEWKVDVVRQTEADRVAKEHGLEIAPRQGVSAFGRLSDAAGSDQARARSTDKRLASIFRPVDELAPGEEGGPAAEQTPPGEETAVNEVRGITAHLADVLTKGGIGTLGALRAADDKALLALPGVGAKTVEKLREAAGAAAATE